MVEKNVTKHIIRNTTLQGIPNQILTFDGLTDPDQIDFTCLDGMIEGEIPCIPYPRRLESDIDFTNRCLHQLDELMRMLHLIHWKNALGLDQYQLQLKKRHCLRLDQIAIGRTFYSPRWANHYAMSIYLVFTGEVDIASLSWVRLYPEFTFQDDIEFIPLSKRKLDGIEIERLWRLKSKGFSGTSTGVTNPITMTITKPSIRLPGNNARDKRSERGSPDGDGDLDVSPVTIRASI